MDNHTRSSEEEGTLPKGGESIGKRSSLRASTLLYIIYIMIFLFLIIGISLIFGFKDANQCLNNPLIYGANKLENQDTGSLTCICNFNSPEYASFYFNSEDVGILNEITFNNNR